MTRGDAHWVRFDTTQWAAGERTVNTVAVAGESKNHSSHALAECRRASVRSLFDFRISTPSKYLLCHQSIKSNDEALLPTN